MDLTRKAFLQAAAALVAGSVIGCGDDDDGGAGGAGGQSSTTTTTSTTSTTTTTTTTTTTGGGAGGSGTGGAGGAGGSGGASASACINNGTMVDIGTNHNHALVVPSADVQAGAEMTYDIQGTSGHAHTVTITAAQFAQLAMDQAITVTSSVGNNHTHTVTVSCA